MKTVTLKVVQDKKALLTTFKVMNQRKKYAVITFYKDQWTLSVNGLAYYCDSFEEATMRVQKIAEDFLNMLSFNTKVELA